MKIKGRDSPVARGTGPPKEQNPYEREGQRMDTMDTKSICSIAQQLEKVSEKVDSLAKGIYVAPAMTDLYEDLLQDELKHVQVLAVELTKKIMEEDGEESGDREDEEGVFAEGDLESAAGEEKK